MMKGVSVNGYPVATLCVDVTGLGIERGTGQVTFLQNPHHIGCRWICGGMDRLEGPVAFEPFASVHVRGYENHPLVDTS